MRLDRAGSARCRCRCHRIARFLQGGDHPGEAQRDRGLTLIERTRRLARRKENVRGVLDGEHRLQHVPVLGDDRIRARVCLAAPRALVLIDTHRSQVVLQCTGRAIPDVFAAPQRAPLRRNACGQFRARLAGVIQFDGHLLPFVPDAARNC